MEIKTELVKVRGGVIDLRVVVERGITYVSGRRFVTTSKKAVDIDLAVLREVIEMLKVIVADIEKEV